MGNLQFGKSTPAAPKQPTVSEALASGQFFSTSYGSLYIQAEGGQIVKLGNSKRPGRNAVVVKPSTYFSGRENEAVTLHGTTLPVNIG